MPIRRHDISWRIELDPAEAADELAEAYRDFACHQKAMAEKKYQVREETVIRWIRRIDARLKARRIKGPSLATRLASIKAQAQREGWHHNENRKGGRPKAAVA